MTTDLLGGVPTDIFRYWGKADEKKGGFHLLAYHSLDVAMVGEALLKADSTWSKRLAAVCRCPFEDVQRLVPYLLSLHDLGKFSEPFQARRLDVAHRLQGDFQLHGSRFRHDSLGFALWSAWGAYRPHPMEAELIPDLFDLRRGGQRLARREAETLLTPWMAAITGHHGRPPDALAKDEVGVAFGASSTTKLGRARADAAAFAQKMRQLFGSTTVTLVEADPGRALQDFKRASWLLAGFVILCDWVGSNTSFFQYRSEVEPLEQYRAHAREQAAKAIRESGLLPVRSRSAGLGELFPTITTASPLQEAALSLPLDDGPQLYILEDLTGSGKTEAAMLLADRLLAAGRADGIFFALPTMATADAMHGRLSPLVAKLFGPGASYLLSHSGPSFQPQDHLALGDRVTAPTDSYSTFEETSASATAQAWLADNRKKALLATMGVGTIDQALLGALQSKHAALRLLGLHRHLLIVDEVHACDCYMLEILCALLRLHAGLGGSAILLSATLPLGQRRQLARAFRSGLTTSEGPAPTAQAYPLATAVGAGRLEEVPVAPRQGSSRDLPLAFHRSEEEVIERLVDAAGEKLCACWVRNSVKDALQAYDNLVNRLGPERVTLFHARFALGDRQAIAERVVANFGPGGDRALRQGQVVIATQVVEQSLDLDFDVLVTDLCPIDLVIQRAGRLQRHRRPWRRPSPILEVLSPPWTATPDTQWLGGPWRRTSYVYPNPAQLWRTAGELEVAGALALPREARRLIETVYGEQAAPPPAGLEWKTSTAEGKELASASVARMARLDLDQGYLRSSSDWSPETRTPTRLGEPTVTVRLGAVDGQGPRAWRHDAGGRLQWPLSQLSIRRVLISQGPSEEASERSRLEATQPFTGDDIVTVLLRLADGIWRGKALAPARGEDLRPVEVTYSAVRGLEVFPQPQP